MKNIEDMHRVSEKFLQFSIKRREKKEEDFLKEKPAVGDKLPEVSIFDSAGKEFKTADLRGHYTVLTFGCLT